MKKYIIFTLIFSILFPSFCFGYYIGDDTEYVWSETTVETSSSEENTDFLDLSCESAILIEQTTRHSSL